MTSSITAHKFAQMQHAEYAAKAARRSASGTAWKTNTLSLIAGKIAAMLPQDRTQIASLGDKEA